MIPNYYEILCLKSTYKKEEIKKAYRKLALEFHPDKNKSADAHTKFISINEAYIILYDKDTREKYDREYFIYFELKKDSSDTSDFSEPYKKQNKETNNRFNDETLNDWVVGAREQAERFAKMAFKEFYGLFKSFFKELIFQISNVILIIIGAFFFIYGSTVLFDGLNNTFAFLSLIIGLPLLFVGYLREKNHSNK
jgi:curved DNA-binding protein CbpA